jgi:hypothetical protein
MPIPVTLVSSASIVGSDKVFIVGVRSFMYIMKSKGPRNYLWGTSCFVPQFVKKIVSVIR